MLLARIATKYAKPDGQFEINAVNKIKVLETCKLSAIPNIGRAHGKTLENHNFITCSDIWGSNVTNLQVMNIDMH